MGPAHLEVRRAETLTTAKGPAERFTGSVAVQQLFGATPDTRASAGTVTFEPGARSVWHSHPAGQTLIVTAGTGWVQEWGSAKQEMRAGDVVWIPPGVKHWHGATATESVTHIAIQEAVNGSIATWMEHVTDEQYGASPRQPHAGAKLDDVSPALARYTEGAVRGGLWNRPGLSPRDRSLVTLAVMVTKNQSAELAPQMELALAHGVKPAEISELLTHLAFYSGWASAMAAVPVARQVFAAHGITAEQLPPATGRLLPIDQAAETQRAARVRESLGATAPGLVQYTTDLLFHDLWLRPALAPRDRSLVTVAALVASGQVAQVDYHLGRAMDNGLTKIEVSEMVTHLAFYAGWPSVFTALPVVKAVLEKRGGS